MSSIFLYEYITGGGLWSLGESPRGSLLREGSAMARALAEDLLAVAGMEVALLRDARLRDSFFITGCQLTDVISKADEREQFFRLAERADSTVIIAPEFGGQLLERCEWAQAAGTRLLSPDRAFISLAANKHRAAAHLQQAGIRVPNARQLCPGDPLPDDFSYPAVIKPADGAGSLYVQLLPDAAATFEWPDWPTSMRLESFHAGTAASVSILSGPQGARAILPACRQRLSDDGRFAYQGGEWPLDSRLGARAARLARRVFEALPRTVGYWGIDVVLGAAADGSEDVLIEINPRLTTSYIGLRRRAKTNLAGAMVSIAAGVAVTIEFDHQPLVFGAGTVAMDATG